MQGDVWVFTDVLYQPLSDFWFCFQIADILKKYPQDYPDGFPQDLEKRRVVHEVLKTLWKAFHTGIHDELNSLPSGRAQIAMDIMQGVSDSFDPYTIRTDTSRNRFFPTSGVKKTKKVQ